MVLKKELFVNYTLGEDKRGAPDIPSLRLNKEERAMLEECKKILEQPKDSTCIKQLMAIGANVLHDNLIGGILGAVFINKRRNRRTGIIEY